MSQKRISTAMLAQLALLSAILFIMGFTPLGSIPLGGPIVATLAQIPVVVGAILLGKKAGLFLGGVFGFVSCLWFSIYAPVTAFVFSPIYSVQLAAGDLLKTILYPIFSLITCFVPRILIGWVSYVVYHKVYKKTNSVYKASILAGVSGSLTNTLLVLLCILVFFAAPYAQVSNAVIWYLLGTSILFNGIPEAIVTPIVTVAVVKPVLSLRKAPME